MENPDRIAVAIENLARAIKGAQDALILLTDQVRGGPTCDASTKIPGAFGSRAVWGPCILRFNHEGPLHKDAKGRRWTVKTEQRRRIRVNKPS